MSTLLKLEKIYCSYDDREVVHGVSLHANKGDIICLLGPSGCGKSTILGAIAGFHPLDKGEILINQQSVSRPGYTLPPEKRRLGMVFQDYALFPHLNVDANVGFGLRHMSSQEKDQRVQDMLQLVGLTDMAKRFPHELSGGQQQRIALARALAPQPDLLLMDEPFSNLDVDMRERLSSEVRDILKQHGTTAVLVTHDQHEAFALGDRVGVMHEGKVLQWDSPYELYHEPNCRFVANFIGQGTFLQGTLLDPETIETEIGTYRGNRAYHWQQGSTVDVLLRPDDIIHDPESGLRAEVVQKAFKGAEILYTLKLTSGNRLLSLFPSHADYNIGDHVGIKVEADHLVAFAQG